jgi:hypothetical protein
LTPLLGALTDLWTAGGGDPAAVSLSSIHPHAATERHELLDRRIDHVLARPGHAGQSIVVDAVHIAGDAPLDGLYPSDHWAVVCDVRWQ